MSKEDPKQTKAKERPSPARAVERSSIQRRRMDGGKFEEAPLSQKNQAPGTGTNVFLTGGTGFVGDLLIRKYLEQTNCKLWVLSRPMNGATAEERILDRVRPRDHHRIRVISGDLGRVVKAGDKDVEPPSTVVDAASMQQSESLLEMSSVVDEVFHNASYLGLKKSAAEKQKCAEVNVQGTKRLLNLMSTFKRRIKALLYTSTAFVHGRLSEPEEFREDDCPTNGWLNPYEESKWKAEELVRNSGYPYRIFRPGMIAREPGAVVLSSHTIYGVADVLESGFSSCPPSDTSARRHLRVRGRLDAAHNIILRSELVDMLFAIRASKHKMNHTYNTLNPKNTRLQDVVYAILHSLDPTISYEFVPHIDDQQPLNRVERLLEKTVYPVYEEYLFKKSPEFDMSNVKAALGEGYVAKHVSGVDRSLLTRLMEDYFQAKRKKRLPGR